jgi:hypothetical protein
MNINDFTDIFEPYERLVEVEVLGTKYNVPENNSILRGFQYLDIDAVSESDLCWNGECLNCQVWIKNGAKERAVIACRTNVIDGMQILKVSADIPFPPRDNK